MFLDVVLVNFGIKLTAFQQKKTSALLLNMVVMESWSEGGLLLQDEHNLL